MKYDAELDGAPDRAIAAVVADRWAARDAARMAELEQLGRCRFCRTWLQDRAVKEHPGLCGAKKCRRLAARTDGGGVDARPSL